jgi:hypothetical protein
MSTQIDLLGNFTTAGQELFKKRSASIVHSLNARMRKRGVSGRLSLDVGRAALAEGVGKPCRYCRERIKIATMSGDHPIPISRGGDPFLIVCICKSCNEIKGEIPDDEFLRFIAFINTFSPESRADLLRRLHMGAFGIRTMARQAGRMMYEKKAGAKKASPVEKGEFF